MLLCQGAWYTLWQLLFSHNQDCARNSPVIMYFLCVRSEDGLMISLCSACPPFQFEIILLFLLNLMCMLWHGCTNSGFQVAWVTKFCMMAPNICEGSVWNVLQVTFLAPRIFMWLLGVLKKSVHPCIMAFHITPSIVLYILWQAVVIAWWKCELVRLEQ